METLTRSKNRTKRKKVQLARESVEDFRIYEAKVHFDDGHPLARQDKELLKRYVSLVGPAQHQAMTMLLSGLKIERDENEKITKVELLIPCANQEDEARALAMLVAKPSNSYHLVEVISREKALPLLRFVLIESIARTVETGAKAGEIVAVTNKLPVEFLQRIITTWLRPTFFNRLPSKLKNGTAQKVAETLASHCGLQEDKGSQPTVGLPSFEAADPKLNRTGPLKRQPLQFADSQDVVIYSRLWHEHDRRRVGLYALIPLPCGRSPWWRGHESEFGSPLGAWGDGRGRIDGCRDGLLLPLSVAGGRRRLKRFATKLDSDEHGRFVRALRGDERQVCRSALVERGGEFFLQIVTKRNVAPIPRPNLLGVHLTLAEREHGLRSPRLVLALIRNGESLPRSADHWRIDGATINLGRRQRKTLSEVAARQLVELAVRLDADLAVEEVVRLKKRGADASANVAATKFNHADLSQFIRGQCLNAKPPVRLFSVSGFCLDEAREQSHETQADLIAQAGVVVQQKVEAKRKAKN